MWEYQHTDELKHYGVLGMKWGVRKNPVKAYAKALRKQEKLARRIEKRTTERDKWRRIADKTDERAAIAESSHKAHKSQLDSATNTYMVRKIQYENKVDKKDFLGRRKKAYKQSEKEYANVVKEYQKESKSYSRIVSEKAYNDEKVRRTAREVEKATAKSEKWQNALKETFKDVPKGTIAAGQKLFEERYDR